MTRPSWRKIARGKVLPRADDEGGADRANGIDRLRRTDDLGIPRPHTLRCQGGEGGGTGIARAAGNERHLPARILVGIFRKLGKEAAQLRIRIFPCDHLEFPSRFSPSCLSITVARPTWPPQAAHHLIRFAISVDRVSGAKRKFERTRQWGMTSAHECPGRTATRSFLGREEQAPTSDGRSVLG